MDNTYLEKFEATNKMISSNATGNSKQIVEKANEHPEWLPDGWRVDIKTRKSGVHMGAEYKIYVDPLNGYKFYSKPEVLRYLDTIKQNSSSSKKKGCTVIHSPRNDEREENILLKDRTCHLEMDKTHLEKFEVTNKEVSSNATDNSKQILEKANEHPEWLPDGWRVDFRTRKSGACMGAGYKYYTDPVNGYVFRSKKDALRYIESADISKCLFKPSKRQIHDEDKSTPSFTARRQKLKQPATKRQLFGGKEDSEKSSIELSDTNSSEKGHNVKMSSGMMTVPVPVGKTVVKMHSLEDAVANATGMNEKSDPADVQEKNYVLNAMKNADEKNHSSPNISENKKRLNGPRRFSRRLAGIEAHQVADPDNMINEQALQVPKRILRKSRTTVDVDLANVSSQKLNVVQEVEHMHKIPGESPDKCGKRAFKEQPHQLETEKMEDNKPEQYQYILPHEYTSPSQEVAMKTTGEIRRTGTQKNRSSSKKDHQIPCRASKRLAGFEPEITHSLNCEKPLEYKDRKSKDEVNAESLQSEGIPAKEFADHASTYINSPRNGESSKRCKKSPKIPPRTHEQLEKLGDEQLDDEKSEPQLSFAFHYSWSDPSVEFAIKTLTGVLPAEDSVDNGPVLVFETDVVEKSKLSKSVTEGSNDKNDSVNDGPVLVPETEVIQKIKSSKSVTEGYSNGPVLVPETDVVEKSKLSKVVAEDSNDKNDSMNNGPVWVPEPDVVLKNKLSKSVTEGRNDKNPQATVKKSKNKKEPSLPRRLSKRLAGHEPEVVPAGRAVEYATRKSCKGEPTSAAISGNGASKQLDVVEETELTLQASNCSERRVLGESLNVGEKPYEAQIVPNEQLQKVEAEKVNKRSEPELSLPFGDSWSDPCLEFAIKTLTGALPVDADAEILPVMTPDLNGPPNQGLLESVVEKCNNEEANDTFSHLQNSIDIDKVCQHSKSQPKLISSTSCENAPKFTAIESCGDDANTTRNLDEGESLHIEAIDTVCLPSKQFLGQPELRTGSISCEDSPKFTARVSHGDQADIIKNLDEGKSLNTEVRNECKLAHQSRNVDTLIQEGPSNNIEKVLMEDSAPTEQPQLETRTENQDKSESHFSAAFMDSWSDPCLEFAFKTLTGAIPLVDNLAIQGCFQEPANNFRSQRDDCSLLPDFGSPGFSHSDISFHYDVEKSMPGQQPSMSSSILPQEKVNPHFFTGFDSQKHYSQCSKNSQGK